MPRYSKRVRHLAADLCSAAATEMDHRRGVVFLVDLWWMLDDDNLDLVRFDQVQLLAGLAFREASVLTEVIDGLLNEPWRMWELQYAEAAAMLREGWSPKGEF